MAAKTRSGSASTATGLPTRLSILHLDISVTASVADTLRHSKSDGSILHGRYHPDTSTIMVDPTLNIRLQQETLLHELLHVIVGQTNLASDGGPLTGDSEEQAIRAISPILIDTLRRNPKLVAFLLK